RGRGGVTGGRDGREHLFGQAEIGKRHLASGRYRRLESRKRRSRSTPERHANLHGIFGYTDRRLVQDIALRYRAASQANIGTNWSKSMERVREVLKKLNVLAQMQASLPSWTRNGRLNVLDAEALLEPPVRSHRLQRMRGL